MNTNETLAAYRATDAELDAEWPATECDALRDRILSSPREDSGHATTRWVGRHRRWVAAGAVAACAAVVVAAVAVTLPRAPPGAPDRAEAASLERLAVVAGEHGGVVKKGQFAYISVTEGQRYNPEWPPTLGQTLVGDFVYVSRKQWMAPDGDLWMYRDLGRTEPCLRMYPGDYREPGATNPNPITPEFGNYEGQSAAQLAKLPTDAKKLATFIDLHPSGEQRGTRNRFGAVSDLVRSGLATPALRAAAIRVLAQTEGIDVRTGVRDELDRPAIRVDYTTRQRVPSKFLHRYALGTESLFFDPSTSRLLEEQSSGRGKVGFRSITKESKIVDAVPSGLKVCEPRVVHPG